MRLEDMLKNISGISNKVINSNCWDGQFNVLEGIQALQSKVNEIITAINDGIIKGDKGDKGDTGDKGDKGDKGDTGKASETIEDSLTDLDHTWSSEKIVNYVDSEFNNIKDIKGIMYSSDESYKVVSGSKNGVVKNLKISGKSLVNVLDYNKVKNMNVFGAKPYTYSNNIITNTGGSDSVQWSNKEDISYCKNDNIYTFVVTNKSDFDIRFECRVRRDVGFMFNTIKPNETFIATSKIIDGVFIKFYGTDTTNTNSKIQFSVYDDDVSQNPPSYFEGIASVGNGNEIEVLSRKEDGNLVSNDDIVKGIYVDGATKKFKPTENTYSLLIKLQPNKEYCVSFDSDVNRGIVGFTNEYPKAEGDCDVYYPRILTPNRIFWFSAKNYKYALFFFNNGLIDPNIKIMVSEGSTPKTYEPYKGDKKPILFKDVDGAWKPVTELRGINLNSCDTIEQHSDGKHYLHIRTEKKVFDGINNLFNNTMNETETNKRVGFVDVNVSNRKTNENSITLICDKESVNTFLNRSNIGFYTVCNDLTSQNGIWWTTNKFTSTNKNDLLTEANNSLKTNPITIIYQLAQEKVYEVNPLDLESFDNETMISFNYENISGNSEFYIDSNLGSVTLENMNRLSRIENDIYQVKKIILNGDYRTLAEDTYPNDFINKEE